MRLTDILIEQKKALDTEQRKLENQKVAQQRQEELLKAHQYDSSELQHYIQVTKEMVILERLTEERICQEQDLEQCYENLEQSKIKLKKVEKEKGDLRKGQRELVKAQREYRIKLKHADERERSLKQQEHELFIRKEEINQLDSKLKRERTQQKQLRKQETKKREDLRRDIDKLDVDKRRTWEMRRRLAHQELQLHNDRTYLEQEQEEHRKQVKLLQEDRDKTRIGVA
eukprot:TRINITY_DN1186_c0_g2_i1.p1 TRINITY_DN1186_c0_g2~~TRINITY_DN1186_c0_g2_i1.p1  ORF type:complete len:228 (-),score=59.67 TRINITY_DN1186_c0_g2_i1:76-759(-)